MDAFLSILFRFTWVLFGFALIYKIALRIALVKLKLIEKAIASPVEEKVKLVQSFSIILTIYKIFFWLAPLNLIFVPVVTHIYAPDIFVNLTVSVLLMYIVVLEDFFYRKAILRRIGN